jgi:transcriptional regulator of heat shock response
MRNQLETFKTLFEQVRGLGIVMQLPEGHNQLSENINLYFAEGTDVTAVEFGKWHNKKVDIMKYSNRDNNYKVSLPIDITDKELNELIQIVNEEYRKIKLDYLKSEITQLEQTDLVELERGEVVV